MLRLAADQWVATVSHTELLTLTECVAHSRVKQTQEQKGSVSHFLQTENFRLRSRSPRVRIESGFHFMYLAQEFLNWKPQLHMVKCFTSYTLLHSITSRLVSVHYLISSICVLVTFTWPDVSSVNSVVHQVDDTWILYAEIREAAHEAFVELASSYMAGIWCAA